MEKEKTILDYDTVALDEAQDAVIIIDQTLLTRQDRTDRFTYGTGNLGCHLSVEGPRSSGHRCSGGIGYLPAGESHRDRRLRRSFIRNSPNIRNIWILPDPPQLICPGH